MIFPLSPVGFAAAFWLLTSAHAETGDIVCRYTATTPSSVNYYTCTQFSEYYSISFDKFLELNPSVDRDCATIKPNTEYCVAGYIDFLVSSNGFCGPQHGGASCLGTDKQCCNSATWQCGDTDEDCAAGTCYEGACVGDPEMYSLDGKCGPKNGDKICAGKWGDCCGYDGMCGSGTDFCSEKKCQSGACEQALMTGSLSWQFGTTPDGTCGGSAGYICDVVFGSCCSKDNVCGSHVQDCGAGCQPKFGKCTLSPNNPPTPTNISPDGSCGGPHKYQCTGSSYGNCCSIYGYCGSTKDYCEAGCQSSFGACLAGGLPLLVFDPKTGEYILPNKKLD